MPRSAVSATGRQSARRVCAGGKPAKGLIVYDGDFSGGDWAVMVVMMFIMLAVLLTAVWLIARPRGIGTGSRTDRDPALDELRSRYARGEIDHDEFERRKGQLG